MIVTYLEMLYPGILVAENEVVELAATTPALEQVDPKAVGFRTFKREYLWSASGKRLESTTFDHSPWTYFGTVVTLANVKPGSLLESNMRCNGYARCVDVGGNVWPVTPDDTILPPRRVTLSGSANAPS